MQVGIDGYHIFTAIRKQFWMDYLKEQSKLGFWTNQAKTKFALVNCHKWGDDIFPSPHPFSPKKLNFS